MKKYWNMLIDISVAAIHILIKFNSNTIKKLSKWKKV